MRKLIVIGLVAGLISMLGSAALAQGMKWRGSGGWGPGGSYSRMYDPKTVESVTGEVLKVDSVVPMKGMSGGVHVMLKTETGEVSLHVGPQWYLENQDVKIMPGDKLEVTGSRVMVQGKPAIIASEVKKGDEVLKLRDEAGVPVWAGWRRRG